METLQVDGFVLPNGKEYKWLQYVDDVLVVIPDSYCPTNIQDLLNKVSRDIKFSVEVGEDKKIPFLVISMYCKGNAVRSSTQ